MRLCRPRTSAPEASTGLFVLVLLFAFVGQAQTPRERTAAASSLRIEAQLFTHYVSEWPDGLERADRFELPRAELGVRYRFGPWVDSELRLEAVRSAGDQSALGIDGNSLVIRVKRAWAGAGVDVGPVRLSAAGGLIADPWIQTVEAGYDLRGMSPLGAESFGLFDTADLGARVAASAWNDRVSLMATFGNGEGRNQIEQNTGKNVTLVLSGEPWRGELFGGPAAVRVAAGYRDGSLGTGSIKNHRVMGAVSFLSPRLGAGVEVAFADGFRQRAAREALQVGVWANGSVLDGWLGLAARYDTLDADQSLDDPFVDRITAALYTAPLEALGFARAGALRLYVTWETELYGADASAVPGLPSVSEVHRFGLRLEFTGAWELLR